MTTTRYTRAWAKSVGATGAVGRANDALVKLSAADAEAFLATLKEGMALLRVHYPEASYGDPKGGEGGIETFLSDQIRLRFLAEAKARAFEERARKLNAEMARQKGNDRGKKWAEKLKDEMAAGKEG